jgi:hypothetical protein
VRSSNYLRIGHKSSCILQPILGHYLEYDGELLVVSYRSMLLLHCKTDYVISSSLNFSLSEYIYGS